MIPVQVQFRPKGDVYTYAAPDDVQPGDRVLVPTEGLSPGPALAKVIALGSDYQGEPVPIIRVVPPTEHIDEPNSGEAP